MKTKINLGTLNIYIHMFMLLEAELKRLNVQNLKSLKAIDSRFFYNYESNALSLEESISPKENLNDEETSSMHRYNLNPASLGPGEVRMFYEDSDILFTGLIIVND